MHRAERAQQPETRRSSAFGAPVHLVSRMVAPFGIYKSVSCSRGPAWLLITVAAPAPSMLPGDRRQRADVQQADVQQADVQEAALIHPTAA